MIVTVNVTASNINRPIFIRSSLGMPGTVRAKVINKKTISRTRNKQAYCLELADKGVALDGEADPALVKDFVGVFVICSV